jgi:transketolase
MRALPDSIILYPCDAVSTHYLVHTMAEYETGVSYMRTTRGDTPVIYDNSEKFVIGGCKILRQALQGLSQQVKDQVCVIAAGITVHEALKAHDILLEKNISVSVIDLYSVKPFDLAAVMRVAHKSGNRVLTVEDHYAQGGIGEMVAAALCNTDITVTSLAVTQLPRSGKPDELLAWARIDAQAIVETVLELVAR